MPLSFRPGRALAPLAALLLLGIALPAAAQTPGEKFVADFERMRVNVLAMVDSMPAEGLRSAPTPGVRDFAQQIEHVAVGNVNLIASGVDADRIPLGMEPEVYLNDKAALKRFVNVAFDRVRDMLTALTEEELRAEGMLFGQMAMPKWHIVQAAYEHGIWTLGATVPYVRLQGGTPHSYGIAPGG
ncbi:MAG: DinB family protein [Gemmatimonadota bacterium]